MDFQKLISSPTAAYQEGLRFFMGEGVLNNTMRQLAADLERCGIDYNVVGAVALNQHGYRRFTEGVNLLMSKEGLERFHDCLVGVGYRPAFEGSRRKFRTADNVPVEVLTAGEYPGDGLPEPVLFPDPAEQYVVIEGIKTVNLKTLIELKLASGMTAPGRLKDLADVQELIKTIRLDENFSEDLSPYVRDKFLELQRSAMTSDK